MGSKNISEKIEYRIDIADYDMKTGRSMQEGGRYLYTVFMCQQAIEKLLKSLHLKRFSKEAPLTHNLVYLQSLLELNLSEEHLKLLAELTAYYIEGRYPSYKAKLSRMVNKDKSSDILKRTEALYKWLKRKMK
jgi:HEPN domain-containing protein